jgi:hypothetical protein
MSNAKKYDGDHVAVHVVVQGESLSKIAGQYRLPDWHAIWLYNTKVRQVYTGDNPDIIHLGDRLFIPRSPEGYDRLIKKFQSLKRGIAAAGDQQMYILEAQHWEYKAWSEMLDFAGDVATTVATFGLNSLKASKAANVANTTTGRGKVAAQYLADQEAENLAKWVGSTFKSESTKGIAKKLDQYHERYTGKETSVGQTTHKTLSAGDKVIKAVRGYSMVGGKFMLDSAEIALSFLSPTKVANVYLWLSTGETVESSNQIAKMQIKNIVQRSQRQMDEKIKQFATERHIVYPSQSSTVGKYINFPPLHINVPSPH